MADQYERIERVLDFVDRTTARGAPLRVATKRAERRFGVDRKLVRAFFIARHPEGR